MRIVPIPCLSDNYAYLLVCRETKEAAIIDASEAGPVLGAIDQGAGTQDSRRDLASLANHNREDVRIVAILSTHHHHDHVGGNEEVRSKLGIDRVYGHASDRGRIPGQTQYLQENETFEIGRLKVRVLHIPGHTLGAVAYVVTHEPDDPVVFTGDTLFIGGCGRLFEGDPPMMSESLSKLAALDPRTKVYCGHEYTESNLRFAAHVEPSNAAIAQARAKASQLRKEGRTTMGATIADELSYNPFLRTSSPEIRRTLGIPDSASPAEALGAIRKAKDAFKIGA
ncbi:MAG: hydroxyacylglutathione hydrolase [Myxococcales bacterium 68-20]|nr:hydroxyacylglutathione hydrolase [Myxococcales bacterium]OJY24321.1 MAG: hydroxyacylglutathione hydrolase [Myxococcales bacterium 68-20]